MNYVFGRVEKWGRGDICPLCECIGAMRIVDAQGQVHDFD